MSCCPKAGTSSVRNNKPETRMGEITILASKPAGQRGHSLAQKNFSHLLRAAFGKLHDPLSHLLADGYPVRDPDQVGVLEFDARALVPIVEQRVDVVMNQV